MEDDGTAGGFDIEFCKAIASAVLGDYTKVEYIEAPDDSTRFELIHSGAADVLFGAITITSAADRQQGIDFVHPIFHTGQGFAVRADSRFQSVRAMGEVVRKERPDGDRQSTTVTNREATICVPSGTSIEQNLADHFTDIGALYYPLGGSVDDVVAAFFSGRCDVLTLDASHLSVVIASRADAAEYRVLSERITREPLAPAIPEDDSEWRDVLNWVVNGLIAAEELGITYANVAALAADPPNTAVARLLGVSYEGGEVSALGFERVNAQFIQRAIAAVGNYGEIYERTIGDAIRRACTPNALATDDSVECPPGQDGLMYALPFR